MNNLMSVDRVAFIVGDTEIYWYGVIMCAAIIVAILVATFYCKVKKIDTELPINIALVVVPSGILSARLFSVLFEADLNLSEYFNFRTGGLSIIGAVIGGAIGLTVYLLIKKPKDKWIYYDTLVVVLILAQAIGRWGNYFNGEVYGQLIEEGSFFAKFPFAVEIDGNLYQALFFYESILDLIGFLVLSLIYLCSNKKGLALSVYLMYYGVIRTIMEGLRQQEYILKFAGLPVSRICSAAMIVIGAVLMIIVFINSRKMKVLNEKK